MNYTSTQKEKAQQFHELHQKRKLFILPNVWDVLSARLLEHLDYPAIATASASIAFSNGYPDGEKIPFNQLLSILESISGNVNIPVSADIESGYATNEAQLENNIKLLIKTGIVAVNLEDSNHTSNNIYSIDEQSNRIKLVSSIAKEMQVPIFINARTDVLLYKNLFPADDIIQDELLKRAIAYKEAGAHCFYPITLTKKEQIQKLVSQLNMPVNILTIPGIPGFKTLAEIGVTRVSLGPSFLKIAIRAMKNTAIELKSQEGLENIIENEITTGYLQSLIKEKENEK